MSSKEPAFTVIDRRGQNRDEEPVVPASPEEGVQPGKWTEVCFHLEPAQVGNSIVLLGRATGLRGDGRVYVADYLVTPIITDENIDWRKKAQERLDTFLACDCQFARGTCALHKLYLPQWQKADMQRMTLFGQRALPLPLERLQEAATRQAKTNLVIPQR